MDPKKILAVALSAIKAAIAGVTSFDYEVVDELPAAGEKGVMYFVPGVSGSGENVCDEFVWMESDGGSGRFEQIGTTSIPVPVITAEASVGTGTGTPSVDVQKTGTDLAPLFTFIFDGLKAVDGVNGITFVPSVTEITGGHRISWTNDGGVQNPPSIDIMDGTPGQNGSNGVTFTPATAEIEGGHRLSWTNDGGAQNPPSVNIMDGNDGGKGDKGDKGDTGNGITSITKTATSGLVDTYTILFTNGTTATFTVTNGQDGQDAVGEVKSVNNQQPDANGNVTLTAANVGALPDSTPIPDNTSDLTNDSGFITAAVDNLINYYAKNQLYTKTEVDAIANAIRSSRFETVAELPVQDIKTNVIYLVPKSTPGTNNIKEEYINLDGTSAGWEKIGDTEIDLSGYVTTTALNTILADYVTTLNLTAILSDYATTSAMNAALAGKANSADLAEVATSGSYSDLSDKPTIPTVDQTYNASSANAQSGVAVAAAIDAAIGTVLNTAF